MSEWVEMHGMEYVCNLRFNGDMVGTTKRLNGWKEIPRRLFPAGVKRSTLFLLGKQVKKVFVSWEEKFPVIFFKKENLEENEKWLTERGKS